MKFQTGFKISVFAGKLRTSPILIKVFARFSKRGKLVRGKVFGFAVVVSSKFVDSLNIVNKIVSRRFDRGNLIPNFFTLQA